MRNFMQKPYILKTFNSDFQEINIWFTNQTNNPLEVEDKINLNLSLIESRERKYVQGYRFLSFAKNVGENIGKIISDQYCQKIVDSAKISATDTIKIAP